MRTALGPPPRSLTLTALVALAALTLGCFPEPVEGSGGEDSDESESSSSSGDATTTTTSAGPTSSGPVTTDTTSGETTTTADPTLTTDPMTTETTEPGPLCGDMTVDPGEECDLGPANSDEGLCTSMCQNAYCGDGLVGPGESCDDGNMTQGDGCHECKLESCGDGVIQEPEQCDDGDADNTDACLDTCAPASCGDGFVQDGVEDCDDQNVDNTDACTTLCQAPACDDGLLSGVETDVDCGGDCGGCALDKACVDPDDCLSNTCYMGECEPPPVDYTSCKDYFEEDDLLPSGEYDIDPDGLGGIHPFKVYCDMKAEGGGWTLVLKVDGTATTFRYGQEIWTNTDTLNPQNHDLDHNQTKLASYHTVPFDEIMIGLEEPIANMDPIVPQLLVLPIAGDSLHALIAPGDHIPTSFGPATWLSLINGSALQPNCNLEGLNARGTDDNQFHRARIGIIGNENNDCLTPDSRLGIGTAGSSGFNDQGPSAGNAAAFNPMPQDTTLKPAYGVVFVR